MRGRNKGEIDPTGLNFFPGYVSSERKLLHDKKAMSWQSWGRRQMLRSRPSSAPLALLDSLAPKPAVPETSEAAIVVEELPIGMHDNYSIHGSTALYSAISDRVVRSVLSALWGQASWTSRLWEGMAAVIVQKKQPQRRKQVIKKQASKSTEATEEGLIASLQEAGIMIVCLAYLPTGAKSLRASLGSCSNLTMIFLVFVLHRWVTECSCTLQQLWRHK